MEGVSLEFQLLGQALVALLLGGIIGWERETAGKWAGLRTHMLVCLAAMFFVKVGQFLVLDTYAEFGSRPVMADPVRIIEAIVTGIAFIGAGTVFRDPDRNVARGLTTAATLLAVAPIGVAIAIDRYVAAVGMTALVFFVLRVLNRVERKLIPKPAVQSTTDARTAETRNHGYNRRRYRSNPQRYNRPDRREPQRPRGPDNGMPPQ